MSTQLSSMLNLCKKARLVRTGAVASEKELQSGGAKLVITCNTASDNTKKKFSQKAFHYNVPLKEIDLTEILECSVAVITDQNLSARIIELIGDDSG